MLKSLLPYKETLKKTRFREIPSLQPAWLLG